MMETDKDIIIAKQNAFISYLKYEIKELNVEKGTLISEIDYLNNKETLDKKLQKRDKLIKSLQNQTTQLKNESILARQLKNKANFNFSYYKGELISMLKEKFPDTWFDDIKEFEKHEKK